MNIAAIQFFVVVVLFQGGREGVHRLLLRCSSEKQQIGKATDDGKPSLDHVKPSSCCIAARYTRIASDK